MMFREKPQHTISVTFLRYQAKFQREGEHDDDTVCD